MISDSFLGLENQHILVTGSSGGIGLDLARKYLLQGAKVSLHYNSNISTLEPLLKEFPAKACAFQASALEESDIMALYQKSNEKFGVINILVANHGFLEPEPIELTEMSLERWRKTMDINVTGVFLFVREFLKQMKSHLKTLKESEFLAFKEFSIVIVGSVAGKVGKANHCDYSTSKSALMYGFTKTLKNEIVKIHPKGRINVVQPAWIKTPMSEEHLKKGLHFSALQTMPLKKLGSLDEVSNAIMFLSSSKASGHTTGSILEVDGGMEGRVLYSLEEAQK